MLWVRCSFQKEVLGSAPLPFQGSTLEHTCMWASRKVIALYFVETELLKQCWEQFVFSSAAKETLARRLSEFHRKDTFSSPGR